MKQLMTLSSENWVFLSVQIMKRKTNMKVPKDSLKTAEKILADPSESTVGAAVMYLEVSGDIMKRAREPARMPPSNWATIYMIPSSRRLPKLEFLRHMMAIVIAGLKCAPDIATPNSVIIHIPSSIPAY